MTDESLLAELKATLAARRREDPLVIAMSQDVKLIRTELNGQSKCVNLALGNSREAVESMQHLQSQIDLLHLKTAELRTEIETLQASLATALERIDKMAQWAKGMGNK